MVVSGDIPQFRTALEHVNALDQTMAKIRETSDSQRIEQLGREAAAHARAGANLLNAWTFSPSTLHGLEHAFTGANGEVSRIAEIAQRQPLFARLKDVLNGLEKHSFADERQKAFEEFMSDPTFDRSAAADHFVEIVMRDPAEWGVRERARVQVLTQDLSYNNRPQIESVKADEAMDRIHVRDASVEELRNFAAVWKVWLNAPMSLQELGAALERIGTDKRTYQQWLALTGSVAEQHPANPLVEEIRVMAGEIQEHFTTKPGVWYGERDYAELGELRSKLDLYALEHA